MNSAKARFLRPFRQKQIPAASKIGLALLGLSFSIIPLLAQKDVPPKHLRFMPLGSQPTLFAYKPLEAKPHPVTFHIVPETARR